MNNNETFKYNPAFLSTTEIKKQFIARTYELKKIINIIRLNDSDNNQHVLVIGQRGSGKSMLMNRIAAEIETDKELSTDWLPVILPEESYGVLSLFDLWLAVIQTIGETVDVENSEFWNDIYNNLIAADQHTETTTKAALEIIIEFIQKQNKRLLLIIENMDMFFDEQLPQEEAWKLRKVLQGCPELMLLSTSVKSFKGIEDNKQAMYEHFRVINLEKVTTEECRQIWQRFTEANLTDMQVRAIEILTGGNPRLITILANFGAKKSFRQLFSTLEFLVDEHTDYFKSNIELLPPVERKVFVTVAEIWDPCKASDIAKRARINTNKVSAMLGRFEKRGIIEEVDKVGRAKYYQLTQRLYNIYYLMRQRHRNNRVRAVINFMVGFYGSENKSEMLKCIFTETQNLKFEESSHHLDAIEHILKNENNEKVHQEFNKELIEYAKKKGVDLYSNANELRKIERIITAELKSNPDNITLTILLALIYYQKNEFNETIKTCDKGLLIISDESSLFFLKAHSLEKSGKYDKAEVIYDKGIKICSKTELILNGKSELLSKLGRHDESLEICNKGLKSNPNSIILLNTKISLLEKLNQYGEAHKTCNKLLKINPDQEWIYIKKANLLSKLSRHEDAIKSYDNALKINPDNTWLWNEKACLFIKLEKHEDALLTYNEALSINPDDSFLLFQKGVYLYELRRTDKAAESFQKYLKLNNKITRFEIIISILFGQAYDEMDKTKNYLNKKTKDNPDESSIELNIDTDHLINIVSIFTALGYGKSSLQFLESLNTDEKLEPLIVAIKMYLNPDEKIFVAKEIMETAKDIVKEIEEKAEELRKAQEE